VSADILVNLNKSLAVRKTGDRGSTGLNADVRADSACEFGVGGSTEDFEHSVHGKQKGGHVPAVK
jgi:hypothetical protein